MKESDILVQIEEIRHQLWLGHASLMVGSGFSRNADKASPTTPTPPDWIGLADKLINRLYCASDDAEKAKIRASKSVLQLADEFDIAFQRPALNTLLKSSIQDDNLLPSALHVKMLELPWMDVFTTNYDTLLERAAQQVINIKYDVVLDCKDLPYSEAPRIIKLHGSFPSEATHLIVSEEDYRTYPVKYSPFVNTVQQAIMESALCLIGFSGTDPNFLKWIGWVKDNLHESMPPIYLIGMLSLNSSERKLLESKNIIPVDLSCLSGISPNDHAGAFKRFFSLLENQPDYCNWPNHQSLKYLAPKDDFSAENFIDVIQTWKKERESYPNWIVPPWEKCSAMVMFTEHWTHNISFLENLPDPWDIIGLYELNWRLEKCLMPIFNNLIPTYEKIIEKYDPYGLKDCKNINKQLQDKWLSLCFAVFRWSREELDEDRWEKYNDLIEKIVRDDIFSLNMLYYERAFHAISLPRLDYLDDIMDKWEKKEHPLFWKVRLASFFSMLGKDDKATNLWKEALNELRPHVPKSKIKNDFLLLSLEGSILVNLRSTAWKNHSNMKNESEDDLQKKYSERLQELTPLGCNPWESLYKFSLFLENNNQYHPRTQSVRNFKSKTTSRIWRNGWDPLFTKAFQSLRFFEEIAIPFVDGNASKTLRSALANVANCSPKWAFCVMNIIGVSNDASCELLFSQEKLYRFSSEKINHLIENYVPQLEYLISNKTECLTLGADNFYSKAAKNLCEVISRLTVKASEENLQKILLLGIELYKIGNNTLFFQNLGSHYFKRTFEAMRPQQILANLENVLSIPIPVSEKIFWQPPALFIDWRGYKTTYAASSQPLKDIIEHLISELDTENVSYRSTVLSYLNVCFKVNLLSNKNKKEIARNLKKYFISTELPPIGNFYKFAYKRFFAPLNNKKEVEYSLKEYYFKETKSFFSSKDGHFVTQWPQQTNFVKMSYSLIATCSVFNKREWMFFDLTFDECKTILKNLENAWNDSKLYIKETLHSANLVYDERGEVVKDTLHKFDQILGEVIIPRILLNNGASQILAFVTDLKQYYDFPITEVAICASNRKYNNILLLNSITALNGQDKKKFEAYSHSVYNAYRFAKRKDLPSPPLALLNALISVIHMKTDETFCTACEFLGSILDFYTLTDIEKELLLIALDNLLRSTSFNDDSDRFLMQDRYDYRQAATFLAAKLYKTYIKKNKEIPTVLQAWLDLGESNEEFPEIRNTWMKVMNHDNK